MWTRFEFSDHQAFSNNSLTDFSSFRISQGTLLRDTIEYVLPIGFLGALANMIFILKELIGSSFGRRRHSIARGGVVLTEDLCTINKL